MSTEPNKELRNFPEFIEFLQRRRAYTPSREISYAADLNGNRPEEITAGLNGSTVLEASETRATPYDLLQAGIEQINQNLASELLSKIGAYTPDFFEKLVVDLLLAMGYGGSREDAGEKIGKSGDGGIDGIIREDRLGLDIIYIQAKRWKNNVGRPEVQQFVGALQGQRARKGVFITTSDFTREAREYTLGSDTKIVLINGDELAHFMIEHNVGVSLVTTYDVKRLDSYYFSED